MVFKAFKLIFTEAIRVVESSDMSIQDRIAKEDQLCLHVWSIGNRRLRIHP